MSQQSGPLAGLPTGIPAPGQESPRPINSELVTYTDPAGIVRTTTAGTNIILATSTPSLPGAPVATTVSSTLASITEAVSSTTSASAAQAATDGAASSGDGGLPFGTKMAAILVPTLVFLALIPIAYFIWLHRRNKKRDREAMRNHSPQLHGPKSEAGLLSSRDNSMSLLPAFKDSDRIKSGALGVFEMTPELERLRTNSDPPATGLAQNRGRLNTREASAERGPSPTLPSPSIPNFPLPRAVERPAESSWPLPAAPNPSGPPPYSLQHPALRGPPPAQLNKARPTIPNVGEPRGLRIPTPEASVVPGVRSDSPGFNFGLGEAHGGDTPTATQAPRTFTKKRESDAISEMSYDPRTPRRRQSGRDTDEMSMVSALDPDDEKDIRLNRLD
jgi:hypothetical protein